MIETKASRTRVGKGNHKGQANKTGKFAPTLRSGDGKKCSGNKKQKRSAKNSRFVEAQAEAQMLIERARQWAELHKKWRLLKAILGI